MKIYAKKILYISYLILLPLLLIGIKLIERQADIYSSITYSLLHHYVSFFLTILSGVLIGADLFFVKNSGLNAKDIFLLKLFEIIILIVIYIITACGILYFLPFLSVSELLSAAGYQLITAVYFIYRRGTKNSE